MAPVYKSPKSKSAPVFGVTLGIAISCLIFLAIPLTQIFTEYSKSLEAIQAIEVAPPPPPSMEEEPPPPPPPEEEPPLPEFEPPPPPISLEQLELALEAGTGSAAVAGDFALPNLSINKNELGGLEIFDISDVDSPPKPIKQVAHLFPMEARRRGLGGDVLLEFIVDQRGNVANVRILKSSDMIFEKSAADAIRQWKFQPAQHDGKVVDVRVRTRLKFNMEN